MLSYPGAHIGAPLRRRGSVALFFIYMVNRSCLFCAETVQRAKAFPRGEGGAAPEQTVICNTAFSNKANTEFSTSFAVP